MPIELLMAVSGLVAGAFGAMLGLGGGILIVPLLTLGFDVPLSAAVGTSLICVIATSTGAAAINVRAGRADVRLGITLGAGTVVGALTGGVAAGFLPERVVAGLFAALLAYTALTMLQRLRGGESDAPDAPALDPAAPDGPDAPAYRSHRLPPALGGSFLAGNVSGLLGVGGGIVTVPLVHLVMGAPMKVAVATSNFMLGMTAAAGAYTYLFRGDVDPRVAAPMVVGVALGAALGASLGPRIRTRMADGNLRDRRRVRGGPDGPSRPGVGMNDDGRDAGELGRGIAAILRVGTIMAVLTIGVGFIVASMTGLPSRGGRPLTDYLTVPGPDAPVAVGLFALTLLPMIAIAYAARAFARSGERHRLVMSLVVLALLGASLVVAAAVGGAS